MTLLVVVAFVIGLIGVGLYVESKQYTDEDGAIATQVGQYVESRRVAEAGLFAEQRGVRLIAGEWRVPPLIETKYRGFPILIQETKTGNQDEWRRSIGMAYSTNPDEFALATQGMATGTGSFAEEATTDGAHVTFPEIDGFQILDHLGEGGMAVVYRAR